MKQSEFFNALENEAPVHLRNSSSLEHAFKLVKSIDDKFTFHSRPDIIRLAERVRINSLPDDRDIFGIEVGVKISHMALVSSDYLVQIIGGWAEQIREELFGDLNPPFPGDIEGAASWVEATAKMDADNAGPAPDRAEAGGLQPGIGFLMRDIYIPAENNVRSIWVRPGTLLYNLSRRVDNLASATGFRKHALTLYLLTGLEPILPRVNICVNLGRADLPYPRGESGSEPRGKLRLAKRSLKVEINTADLTPDELKAIYEHYRRELKVRKMKSLSPEQTRLYYMVCKKGGPPQKGSKEFWLKMQEEWNSNSSNKPYKSWEGVYQRYKIVKRKMDSLYLK